MSTINDYIAYYPFNGNRKDEIGTNNLLIKTTSDFELIGSNYTFTSDKEGNSNNAIEFSGDGVLYTRGSITGNTTASMSFWMYYGGSWGGTNQILATWNSSLITFGYFSGSDTILLTTDSSGRRSSNYDDLITGWNHIVVTRNGTEYKCYINGNEQTYGTSNYWTSSGSSFVLGRRSGATNSYFTGKLDDIKLFTRTLSSSEVSDIYSNSISQPTDVYLEWDFTNKDLIHVVDDEYVTDRNSNPNSAYNFDSTELTNVRLDLTNVISTTTISISLWYKYLDDGESYNVLLTSNTGNYNHLLIDNSTSYIGHKNSSDYFSTTPLSNDWQHICLVKNGNNVKIYVNAVEVLNDTNGLDNSSYPLAWIGNGQLQQTESSSALDDIKIYDFELTPSQVSELYNESSIPDTPTVTSATPNYTGFPNWDWNTVEGATSYRYSYDESTWTTTTNTSFTPASQLSDGSYTLYVQSTSDETNYSTSGSFTVTVTSDVPEPIISVSLNSNNTPRITWSSITGVTNYKIYRYTVGNSEYSAGDEANFETNATLIETTTSTLYTDTSDLDSDVVYYYAVKANAE